MTNEEQDELERQGYEDAKGFIADVDQTVRCIRATGRSVKEPDARLAYLRQELMGRAQDMADGDELAADLLWSGMKRALDERKEER